MRNNRKLRLFTILSKGRKRIIAAKHIDITNSKRVLETVKRDKFIPHQGKVGIVQVYYFTEINLFL